MIMFWAGSGIGHVDTLQDIFTDDGIWFIEEKTTQEWFTEDHTWTSDPLLAKRFGNYYRGFTYAMNQDLDNFIVTEHEFPEL